MLISSENQVIALAGIFQSIATVKRLAYTGHCNEEAFSDSINSVLTMNAESVGEIYRNGEGVRVGLDVLKEQLLSSGTERDPELSRYAITIIHLESRLRGNTPVSTRLHQGILQLESQVNLSGMSDTVVRNMAELYSDTISQLTPRIMVNGDSKYLTNDHIAARIRASLLAAMRAAVLWRQCGGTRLKLLFKRNHYLEECNRIISTLQ